MTDNEHSTDFLEKLTFETLLDAQLAVDILQDNGITARLVEAAPLVGVQAQTEVWVRQTDAERARDLLELSDDS